VKVAVKTMKLVEFQARVAAEYKEPNAETFKCPVSGSYAFVSKYKVFDPIFEGDIESGWRVHLFRRRSDTPCFYSCYSYKKIALNAVRGWLKWEKLRTEQRKVRRTTTKP
jgi:hypothetical protein